MNEFLSPTVRTDCVGRRGRYFTILEAAKAYPIFTPRLLRRLVQERRIAFTRAGRAIVLAEFDIEDYLEHNRVEPPRHLSRASHL